MRLVAMFLLFIFSYQSYGQDSAYQIKEKWQQAKATFQKRSNILVNLTKKISSSLVYKNQSNTLNDLAIDFNNYVDVLNLDSTSISTASTKNTKLLVSLLLVLSEIDNIQEVKSNPEFAIIQRQLEGCENRIKRAIQDYNEICTKFNRHDLVFLTDYQKRHSTILF